MSELPKCNDDIYENGEVIGVFAGPRATKIEEWKNIIQEALPEGTRIDWHQVGGRAVFKCLGDCEAAKAEIAKRVELFYTELGHGEGGYPLQGHSDYISVPHFLEYIPQWRRKESNNNG